MDENDERHRGTDNAILLAAFVILVGAGVWLLSSMADIRKTQDCSAQGRRNCGTIEVPDRFEGREK